MKRLLISLCLLIATACGYRFVRAGENLPEGIQSVCAPMLMNRTSESALETIFTQSLREQLTRAGVLGGTGSCEASLEGEILGVGASPTILGFADAGFDRAQELRLASYRTTVVVRLHLIKGGRILRATEVAASEDFLPGAELLDSEANRQAALRRLADELMRDAYERLASPEF